MSNSKIKNALLCAIKIIIILVCLLVVMWKLTTLCERKDSVGKYNDFFEQKEDFDVLFMGTSHVINAVYPMELWDEQGIVSYNFGGHSNVMATTYWVLQNALDYTNPKLVVIDCLNMETDEKTSAYVSHVHISLDAFKPSITKFKAVRDLLDDDIINARIAEGDVSDNGEERTMMGLLWDFSVYHPRWKELTEGDFSPVINCEKGAEARIRVAVPNEFEIVPQTEKFGNTLSMDYLRRTIRECKARGIEVLLVDFPYPANNIQQMAANTVRDIASEEGVNYINYLDLDVVDFNTDFYDEDSHLNPSGARKVTKHLGEYIKEHYDIPDRREDVMYASWNNDYLNYRFYMLDKAVSESNLDNYLMLLADDKYNVTVELCDEELLTVKPYKDLLLNLGIDAKGCGIYSNYETEAIPEQRADDYRMRVVLSDSESGGIIDDAYWYYDVDEEGMLANVSVTR